MKSLGLKDITQCKYMRFKFPPYGNRFSRTVERIILEEVESEADELIKLFGGRGVKVEVETTPESPFF